MNKTKYVAHRGYSMKAPENTLASFELAGRSGFWAIECDTYCTTDGRWIVHHDRTVDRMTSGRGPTKDYAFEAIRALDIVSGNGLEDYSGLKIPTLEEVLAVCKKHGMHAFVEIEEYHRDEDLRQLVRLVEDSGMIGNCAFICFDADNLRKVRQLHRTVPLGYLSERGLRAEDLELARSLGGLFLDYQYTGVTPGDVRSVREQGIEISVWTVNSQEEAAPFIAAGVNYVTTDTALHRR